MKQTVRKHNVYVEGLMTKKTYKILTIICLIIALIGLVSFVGGIKPVNIGAFVFPLILAIVTFILYKK